MTFDFGTLHQNTQEWRQAHCNKITSSLAHKVYRLKTNEQKVKLAQQIRNGYQKQTFEPPACYFGKVMEPRAIEIYFHYIRKFPQFHNSKLKTTGLLTLKNDKFIGTSPDCLLCIENEIIPVEIKVNFEID